MIQIALLRAVNLAGRNAVAMADLRDLLSRLGFDEPRTLLQSGNVVFGSRGRGGAALERLLEAEARKRLRLDTAFFVRSAEEWRDVIALNPFRKEAAADPSHLLVMFLKDAPKPAEVEALRGAIKGRELVRAEGRQAYIVYPDGIGRSKLTATLIESKLGTRGTGRNWNTVLKLGAAVT